MKNYIAPELEIVKFKAEDITFVSSPTTEPTVKPTVAPSEQSAYTFSEGNYSEFQM